MDRSSKRCILNLFSIKIMKDLHSFSGPHCIDAIICRKLYFDLLFKYKHYINSFRAEVIAKVLFFVEIAIQYDEN